MVAGVKAGLPSGRKHSHCQGPRGWAPKQILSKATSSLKSHRLKLKFLPISGTSILQVLKFLFFQKLLFKVQLLIRAVSH